MKKGHACRQAGFTLVELLIVIAILAIAGALVVTILTRSLRGSNKSAIVSAIKQNGQSALGMMDKTIRNSDNIVCVSDTKRTLVIVKDGIYTRYRFIVPTMVNGSIQQDAPQQLPEENDDIKLLINRICTDTNPLQAANILTDMNSASGVSVISGTFDKSPKPGYKDSVTIQFVLKPGIAAPEAIAGQIEPVTFQTTIQLR